MTKFILLFWLLGANAAWAEAPANSPQPDPSVMTVHEQEKQAAALRELFDSKIQSLREEIKQIKNALDFQDGRQIKRLDDMPAYIDSQLGTLERLTNEKFKAVDQQFQSSEITLAAALQAQKNAVDDRNKSYETATSKAEAATEKQIDGIQSLINSTQKATEEKIESVKQLLASGQRNNDDKINEVRNTISDLRTTSRVSETAIISHGNGVNDLWGYIVAGAGILIAFLAFILPKIGSPAPVPITPQYYQYSPHFPPPQPYSPPPYPPYAPPPYPPYAPPAPVAAHSSTGHA